MIAVSSPRIYKWLVVGAVGTGVLTGTLDGSIVNLAYPRLTEVFHTDASTIVWVTVAFLLVSTGLALPLGTLGDTIGRRRVYTAGFLVFTVGLALVPLSQNVAQLIALRVLQGVGQGMLLANGNALIVGAFPDSERGKALGINGALVGVGLAVGPVLGGMILEFLDWQALFWTRIPVGVVGVAIALLVLRPDGRGERPSGFDYAGTATLFAGLSALLLFVNQAPLRGLLSPAVLGLAAATVVALAAFVVVELRTASPVFALALFRQRLFTFAVASSFLQFVAQAAIQFLLPFYLLRGVGFRPIEIGPILVALPITRIVVSPLSGALSDRFGTRVICTVGLLTMALGCVLLLRLDAASPLWEIVVALLLEGIGGATFLPPNNSVIVGSVPRERLGMASAVIPTVRQAAISLGTALVGTVYAVQEAAHESVLIGQGLVGGEVIRQAVVGAYKDAMLVALVFILLAIPFAAVRGGALPASARKVAERAGRRA